MYSIKKYTLMKPGYPEPNQDPDEEQEVLTWEKYGITWKEAIQNANELDDISWNHESYISYGLSKKGPHRYIIKKSDNG